jgi:hypothetical protein
MKHVQILLLITATALLYNCAKQTSPTGGPKDTIPPILVQSVPEKNSTNFNEKNIQLTFDEHIILNNPKEQILVSPSIGNDYEIKYKKKTVSLTLKTDLQPNTTYLFNFRDAIQDITEKNPAENLQLALSTGSYIDSLEISGVVTDPLQNKPLKDITVALYTTDTFNIFKHKPNYITKTDKDGKYQLSNIKSAQYKLYGFNDKNKNLIVDSKTETYGFQTETINLTENQRDKSLNQIKLDARPLKATSLRPYNTYFNAKFTKGIKQYRITNNNNDSLYSILTPDRANIKIYNTNHNVDSTLVQLTAHDSLNQTLDTTFYLKYSNKPATPEPFEITINQYQIDVQRQRLTGQITYNKPIAFINTDSILYRYDSINYLTLRPNHIVTNRTLNKLIFQVPLDKATLTQALTDRKNFISELQLKPASIISIEGDTAKSATQKVPALTLEDTGTISVHVKTTHPVIIQLLTKNFEIVAESIHTPKHTFQNLKPGDYLIRIIQDDDLNREWTPGNFQQQIPTEKIYWYQNDKKETTVSLKANWELGPLLISTE